MPSKTVVRVGPVLYDVADNGDILLPEGAPFDGNPVLIRLASGWCEAEWEKRYSSTFTGDASGFVWVCLGNKFEVELDDALEWCPLPLPPPPDA